MANSQALETIAADATFRGRCIYFLTQAAVTVAQNSSADPKQQAYAGQILNGQMADLSQLALDVLANATIAAEATVASLPGCTAVPDGDIQFAVDQLFNNLANDDAGTLIA